MKTSQYAFTVEYLKLSKEEQDINDDAIEKYRKIWWYNTRIKSVGGLRLTDAGLKYLQKYNGKLFLITFPEPINLSGQILIALDNIIDCPYHISSKMLYVTDELQCAEVALYQDCLDVYLKSIIKQFRKVRNENQPSINTRN